MKKLLLILFALTLPMPSLAVINASMNWYIRTDGNELNGGGYDASVANAGTNYSDQASPQILFDGATITASAVDSTTTLTPAGYTPAVTDIGNVIRISSDTAGFAKGYFVILATTSLGGGSWIMDSNISTATASGMRGRMGGAHAGFVNLATSANTLAGPLLPTPLVAGNTINVRGSGSLDPGTTDYNYGTGYYNYGVLGTTAQGPIKIVGYNGRPSVGFSGILIHAVTFYKVVHMKFVATGNAFATYGAFDGSVGAYDCIFDQNGYDVSMFQTGGGTFANAFVNNEVRNSGSKTAGTSSAVTFYTYSPVAWGNYVHDVRGTAFSVQSANATLVNNIITNAHLHGIQLATGYAGHFVFNNTIDGCTNSGIFITTTASAADVVIGNNIITNNANGIKVNTGTTAANDALVYGTGSGYNNVWNNSTSNYVAISTFTTDVSVDPQFTSTAGGNYSIGTNLKGAGFPGLLPGSASTGYLDMGAVQRQEAGAGGTKGWTWNQ